MDVLCTLLKRGADKDLADEALGRAAGSIGAREADLNDVIRFLLEQGANVDAGSGLMKAANMGRLSIMQTLLGAGADINLVNSEGKTALIIALEQFGTNVAT